MFSGNKGSAGSWYAVQHMFSVEKVQVPRVPSHLCWVMRRLDLKEEFDLMSRVSYDTLNQIKICLP
jgi:hypothetical protein